MNVAAPVIVPALIAGVVWLIAGRLWRRPPAKALMFGGAPAVALAFLGGHVALVGWPPFPPVTAAHTLVYAGLIAGFIGIAEAGWGLHWASRWGVRAILAAGAGWWQFKTLTEHAWSTAQSIGWLAAVTISVCIVCESADVLAKRRNNVATPILFWLTACAASVGLVFGASALLGQIAGCIAAACGAAVVLTLWSRNLPLHRGAAGLIAFLIAGLIWQGHFYAELPLISAALLLATLVVACAVEIALPKTTKPPVRLTAIFGVTVVTAAVALAIAYSAYRAAAAEAGEYVY